MDKKIFDKLIKDIDRSDLEKLTYKMIQLSGQTEQTFLDYCQENISSEHKNLVIERQIKMHWSNAYEIISDDNRYGGCSDSDEEDAIYEVEALTELVEENMVSWVCRKEILDEMLQQIAYDNSGFVDFLVDTAIKFCRTKDEKIYLVDSLSRIGSSYYKGVAASMYKELGLDDKYVEARKANLRYGSDYIELSYYYKKRNQNDLALKVALDGLNNCDGRLDEIYYYLFQAYECENNETALWELYQTALKKTRNLDTITELVYGYYKKQHDYDKQKEMLLCMVRCCKREQVMTWYKKCVEELNESDWRIKELEVLSIIKKVNLSTYLDICLGKGNRAEVLEQIQNNRFSLSWNNIDGGHKYSKILAKSHPNEILTLYWKEANDFIRLGKDKNYNHAVSVLKEIQTIMKKSKQTDIWNKQFNELKEHHKRKRNLMNIIEASGIQNR